MNKALKIVLISAAGLAAVTAVAGLAYNLEAGVRAWVGGSAEQSSSSAQPIAVTASLEGGYQFAAAGAVKQAVFSVTPASTADKTIVIGGWDGQYQDIRFVDHSGNYLDGSGMPTYQSGETAYLRLDGTFTGDRILDLWPEANPSNVLELTFTCAVALGSSAGA